MVLQDIDLDIAAGRRVAVVGETGSGKSTVAKLLTRLMDPVEGAVLLDGIDVRRIGQASLRRSVVLVPQEGFLFDDTHHRQRPLRPARRHRGRHPGQCRRARARRLAGRAARGPRHPGRPARRVPVRRRAPARRAPARPPRRPRPPGARRGDQCRRPPARDADRASARRLMSGRTSVTIAHRMSTAESADEVVVVDRGRIVQRGPHAELVAEDGWGLRRAARLLGGPARQVTLFTPTGVAEMHSSYRSLPPFLNRSVTVRSATGLNQSNRAYLESGSTPRGGGWCDNDDPRTSGTRGGDRRHDRHPRPVAHRALRERDGRGRRGRRRSGGRRPGPRLATRTWSSSTRRCR